MEILWNQTENAENTIRTFEEVNQNRNIDYSNDINELFKNALLENRLEFVNALIKNGIDFTGFQTKNLKILYNNQVHPVYFLF